MAAEVKLDVIIEALEMADDSISSYLDVETEEVHAITESDRQNRSVLREGELGDPPSRHHRRIAMKQYDIPYRSLLTCRCRTCPE